ncbi:MAG: hypothetical protein QM516_10150, partial [Limnohabitans sp.]|nr:hypothetical protein [Limnohabitans sp.]
MRATTNFVRRLPSSVLGLGMCVVTLMLTARSSCAESLAAHSGTALLSTNRPNAAQASETQSADEKPLSIAVTIDDRVTLLSIVARLSGADEYNDRRAKS